MKAGGCTVHQALTLEAASILKQAVSLAQKRGHSQVTPLHVASSMLSSPSGLLRAACLQSHSHPLQCKALELCFNVALNRLPATAASSGLMLIAYHQFPALSNALVAAFKRAQAHQRRGSMESQQQTLITVKIELDQLIISILDDPSVSRVMREAGFSSTQVKCNVPQAISSDTYTPIANPSSIVSTVRREDVNSILDTLVSREKRSIAVVGECLSASEAVVRVLMDMVNKGEVSESLRRLQFINIQLSTFENMSAEEVQHKVGELRCLARSCCLDQRGSVLFLGDLKELSEYTSRCGEKKRGFYCPIESMLREIGKWVCDGSFDGETVNGDMWLLGIASYPTYQRCRVGNPSLNVLLGLHALTIPTVSLGLSHNFDRDLHGHTRSKRSEDGNSLSFLRDGSRSQKDCHPSSNANGNHHGSISCNLPSWLHVDIEEKRKENTNDLNLFPRKDQCGERSSIENAGNSNSEKSSFSLFKTRQILGREFHFMITGTSSERSSLTPIACSLEDEGKKPSLRSCSSSNPNLNSSSTSSSGATDLEYIPRFKELNAENLNALCNVLEKEVPWQKDIIPDIASIILQCRSGMTKRKDGSFPPKMKEDTWLFFQGDDSDGKVKIARELAFIIFGSHTNLTTIRLGAFSLTRSKRLRSETSHSYIERFIEAMSDNSHNVVMMEDIDQLDYYCQKTIKDAIERGKILGAKEEEVSTEDAIIILSCKSYESKTRSCSPSVKQKKEGDEDKEDENENFSSSVSLDLNLSAEDNMQHCDQGLLEIVDRNFVLKLQDDL